ncbi:hypothetical protein GGR51DRAFT_424388 [Nemania sp. FL0031]|nr:hypothetical protein GGR51DRAFT_424388 [Nemania sp. FL0031]
MKSTSVATAAAILAGMAVAQPHGHHGHHHQRAKRELVTEWETVWETVTVLVDESTTETIYPTHTSSGAPGEFFQPPASTTSTPEPTVVQTTTSVQAPPTTTSTPTPTTSTTSSSTSSPPPPPAPTTTTSTAEPAPTTSSVEVATPATSSSAPASGSSYAGADGFGTSSMDSAKYSGDITYYTLGLGACGYDDSGVDLSKHIVALSHVDWYNRGSGTSLGLNMPNHPWCDQTITISAGGKSTTALVHDICPGCAEGSIDVSESVFEALFGSLDGGRESASWSFN